MNKKFILSVVSYFVGTMATAFPWHVLIFHEKYVEMGAMTRGEPVMVLGMTAVVLQALVFSYFYPMFLKYKAEPSSIKNGIKFCLLMGINVWTVMVFATAAKFSIEPVTDFILYGTVFQLIQYSVVGALLGLIHKL